MLVQQIEQGQRSERKYGVRLARSHEEVREAQRLRYRVFAEEIGARLNSPQGIDEDEFDAYCEHLLVRDEASGEVVGTYRILAPEEAARIGRLYSEREFDLGRLAHLKPLMTEVGRSCIHPAFRNGTVIALLWAGLARYVLRNGYEYLIGCASMGLADGGANAWAVFRKLSRTSLAPAEYRVFPNNPLPLREPAANTRACVPPLLKGYLRVGAYVCGDPAWDADFNTADLLVLLPMSRVDARYARHFLGEGGDS